jgi:hypothetical protein
MTGGPPPRAPRSGSQDRGARSAFPGRHQRPRARRGTCSGPAIGRRGGRATLDRDRLRRSDDRAWMGTWRPRPRRHRGRGMALSHPPRWHPHRSASHARPVEQPPRPTPPMSRGRRWQPWTRRRPLDDAARWRPTGLGPSGRCRSDDDADGAQGAVSFGRRPRISLWLDSDARESSTFRALSCRSGRC